MPDTTSYDPPADPRPNRGFHPVLERDHPYVFVDGCMQIWPDADFARAHRHGCTCYAVTATRPHTDVARALGDLMGWHLVAREHPRLRVAWSVEDVRAAKRDGGAALLLAAQDGEFVGGELHRLEAFWRLGLRMIIPAYNRDNLHCGGALDRTGAGLSAFGVRFVEECDRLGLVLDASHVSRRAALEMIETSANPVVFSHANPRALSDNPRNLDDERIRACAASGGVIGAVNWGPLVYRRGMARRPTVDDFLDHIDYLADLLGTTENIGIGTDFSLGSYPPHGHDPWGGASYPAVMAEYDRYMPTYQRAPERFVEGFSSYPEVVGVIERLEGRGYADDDVAGILGENFLRVFARVWRS